MQTQLMSCWSHVLRPFSLASAYAQSDNQLFIKLSIEMPMMRETHLGPKIFTEGVHKLSDSLRTGCQHAVAQLVVRVRAMAHEVCNLVPLCSQLLK